VGLAAFCTVGPVARFGALTVRFALPALAAVKASRADAPPKRKYLAYWIVLAALEVFMLESSARRTVRLVPFKSHLSILLSLWLQLPYFHGATLLYDAFHAHLRRLLDRLKDDTMLTPRPRASSPPHSPPTTTTVGARDNAALVLSTTSSSSSPVVVGGGTSSAPAADSSSSCATTDGLARRRRKQQQQQQQTPRTPSSSPADPGPDDDQCQRSGDDEGGGASEDASSSSVARQVDFHNKAE